MVHNKKRHILIAVFLSGLAFSAFAGDAARFVNLGFSPDSRIFMFAQHGIQDATGHPYAEVYTVDVVRNAFVTNGVVTRTFPSAVSPGQDGSAALYTVLPDLREIIRTHRINHLTQGRLVYLLVNGADARERIEFRDFETGNAYDVRLTQQSRGSGDSVAAMFHLDVTTRFADGTSATHQVGRPGYFRDDVSRYRISQILVSPDERSLVIVVERLRDMATGTRVRYMVETVRIR